MKTSLIVTFLLAASIGCGDDSDKDLSPDGRDDSDGGAAASDHGDGGHGETSDDASSGGASSVDDLPLPCTETVSLIDFKLVPSTLTLAPGETVLCAKNDGKSPHDLSLRDADDKVIGKTPTLKPGEVAQFSVEVSESELTMFCSIAGHESLGMKGTVTVR